MSRQFILIILSFLTLTITAQDKSYFRCGNSNKYHVYNYCEGLRSCRREVTTIDNDEACDLVICKFCEKQLVVRPNGRVKAECLTRLERTSKIKADRFIQSQNQRKTPHFYWLRYLVLGLIAGLFKVGKRIETIGAVIGVIIFMYWIISYVFSNTFKLNYTIIQSCLCAFGFGISQVMISQLYKNKRINSLLSSLMTALSKSEVDLRDSEKKNDRLINQISKLNLTQKHTEEALRRSQEIIIQFREINPQQGSAKIEPVVNAEHINYLRGALEKATTRIVITTGWIRNSVVNDGFKQLFINCLDRNVEVFIYYGFRFGNQHKDSDQEAVDFFNQMNASYTNFIFRNRPENYDSTIEGNHSKILIQDERFVVLGSFNWLSNSGKLNKNLEMSIATNDTRTIRQVISKI